MVFRRLDGVPDRSGPPSAKVAVLVEEFLLSGLPGVPRMSAGEAKTASIYAAVYLADRGSSRSRVTRRESGPDGLARGAVSRPLPDDDETLSGFRGEDRTRQGDAPAESASAFRR